MTPALYARLLHQARNLSRRAEEAEDLLQTVMLAAVKAGRDDLTCPQNRRWIHGALRKRAAFEARSAVRRRAREREFPAFEPVQGLSQTDPFLASLPESLRRTAALALSGHTRGEIACLLRISDAALRQRISQIRRRWRAREGDAIVEMPGLSGTLPFGLMRRALVPAMQQATNHLGSHDPDGHLFVLSAAHKTVGDGN